MALRTGPSISTRSRSTSLTPEGWTVANGAVTGIREMTLPASSRVTFTFSGQHALASVRVTSAPRLAVEVHEGVGPPLLLVHGLLASRAAWTPNLPALGRVSRPVVVELWGHGRSPSPEDSRQYHPDAYVEQFDRILAELGAERWFVCGLSLGAALTIRYAVDRPDRVIGHVFTNSSSALGDDAWVERLRPVLTADAERIATGGRRALENHPLNPARGRRLPPEIRERLAADCTRHDPAGVARTLLHTLPASPVRDRIHANERPALLVAGRFETAFADHRAYAAAAMPGLRVVEADAGHAVNLEAAAAFDEAVTAFVNDHA